MTSNPNLHFFCHAKCNKKFLRKNILFFSDWICFIFILSLSHYCHINNIFLLSQYLFILTFHLFLNIFFRYLFILLFHQFLYYLYLYIYYLINTFLFYIYFSISLSSLNVTISYFDFIYCIFYYCYTI